MAEAIDITDRTNLAGGDLEGLTPELKCVAYDKIYEDVEYYRCSCSSEKPKEFTHPDFYFDVCIGPHITRKHEVLDYEG